MEADSAKVAAQIGSELAAMALEARDAGLEALARLLEAARAEAEQQAEVFAARVHAKAG